jgi:hypothetical protein
MAIKMLRPSISATGINIVMTKLNVLLPSYIFVIQCMSPTVWQTKLTLHNYGHRMVYYIFIILRNNFTVSLTSLWFPAAAREGARLPLVEIYFWRAWLRGAS